MAMDLQKSIQIVDLGTQVDGTANTNPEMEDKEREDGQVGAAVIGSSGDGTNGTSYSLNEEEYLVAKRTVESLMEQLDIEIKKHSQTACCCRLCMTNLLCGWWDVLFSFKFLFICVYMILGPIFSISCWFIPDTDDNNSAVYNGNLLVLFTIWYFVTNIFASYCCYKLWPERKFILCILWIGFTMGALEHLETFIDGSSLYNRNQTIYEWYTFLGIGVYGLLPLCWCIFPWIYNFEELNDKIRYVLIFIMAIVNAWVFWYCIDISFINPAPFGDTVEWHYLHCVTHLMNCIPSVFVAMKYYYNERK